MSRLSNKFRGQLPSARLLSGFLLLSREFRFAPLWIFARPDIRECFMERALGVQTDFLCLARGGGQVP